MGNPQAFVSMVLTTAKKASAQTGVLTSVILAQWANETDWGAELNGSLGYGEWNFGNVSPGGSVASYPNRAAGLAAYISNMNASTYKTVRAAKTWESQAKALGASRWATGHYIGTGQFAYPGGALVTIIQTNSFTQYDSGVGGASHATGVGNITGKITQFATTQQAFFNAYGTQAPVPPGLTSTTANGDVYINGTQATVLLGDCLITVQLSLSITKSSSLTLTIHDPTRRVIKSQSLMQASTVTLQGANTAVYTFVLQGVEKEGSVLTLTCIPWVVYALQQATGAFTISPGTMTRTDFAEMLVSQIEGARFAFATEAYLANLKQGYAHTTKEQLSRGTIDSPLENSWTCLQRLASEIQWVCFESLGTIYFGPYSYLASQVPVLAPQEFKTGITTITGDWTTAQPTGEVTISCVADSWTPLPGQCVWIQDLGPFSLTGTGRWIVSEVTREDIEELTITVTLMQPQPGLPEPTSGGTNPAVGSGAGNVQTTGGKTAAGKALAFALSKVGHPYSETPQLRLGPTYYDCSGLVYEAYLSVGIKIGSNTFTQWPGGAGTRLPAKGFTNLLPGDLLFFAHPTNPQVAQHVAMVDTVQPATPAVKATHGGGIGPADGPTTPKYGSHPASPAKPARVKVVEAADPAQGVITTSNVNPTVGAYYGSTLIYIGATRPAP